MELSLFFQFLMFSLKLIYTLLIILIKTEFPDKMLPYTDSPWNFFCIKNSLNNLLGQNTFSGQPIET